MLHSFDEHYRCYPVSFVDKSHLEDGDKSKMNQNQNLH